MRLLFKIDKLDYDDCIKECVRNSSRSIIIKDGKVAMVHSLKYDYYKFPGGGIEEWESPIDALIRETLEEAGLEIIPSSIKEYGYVFRKQKSNINPDTCFIQDNYYYLCSAYDNVSKQKLDDYESDERFTLEFVNPLDAINTNKFVDHGPKDQLMIERDARVLELLIKEKVI